MCNLYTAASVYKNVHRHGCGCISFLPIRNDVGHSRRHPNLRSWRLVRELQDVFARRIFFLCVFAYQASSCGKRGDFDIVKE